MIDLERAGLDHVLPSAPGSADWEDVLSRVRVRERRRRRQLVVLAVAALVVVGTASAFGAVRDFFLEGRFIGVRPERPAPGTPATPSTPESRELVLEPAQASAIAFVGDFRGHVPLGTVYVVTADGSGRERLAHDVFFASLAWSPDGGELAFVRGFGVTPETLATGEANLEIYVMNADGSGQRRLAYGTQPLWSPDGRKIAFRRSGPVVGGLYVMNADGSAQRRLARLASGVAWSPA
jgi:dipeptidyl aminopeptidase/acylaminoacyl peptidase